MRFLTGYAREVGRGMELFSQLVRPFSIRGTKTGSEWRPRLPAVIGLYVAVFGFGYLLANPVAHLGMMLGLGAIANCTMTLAAIIGGVLLLMWVFDKFIAGPIGIHPRVVRALFYQVGAEMKPMKASPEEQSAP